MYNPFGKRHGELVLGDLKQLFDLKTVEGYYLQFMPEFPSAEKLSQSIASFANTYGGWIIIGAKADQHVPLEICGFNLQNVANPVERATEIINNEIDPVPVFYQQLLILRPQWGVLIIYVPENQEMPFITKDGRIYRRTHDASEPVPEINRYAIDRLFDMGRSIFQQFESFCEDQSNFPKQTEVSSVQLYLKPYPIGIVDKRQLVSENYLNWHLKQCKSQVKIPFSGSMVMVSGYTPFNFGQVTDRSIVLRQMDPVVEEGSSLTGEYFTDGSAKFFIPLHYHPVLSKWNLNQIGSNQVRNCLSKILARKETNPSSLYFLATDHLWLTIASLLSYYQNWLSEDPLASNLLFSVKINLKSRSIPFFDSSEWGEYVERFGLPIINQNLLKIPNSTGRGGGSQVLIRKDWPLWLEICYFISLALGLPPELYSNILLKTIERAAKDSTFDGGELRTIRY